MFWFYFELMLWFIWQLPQNLVALCMMPFLKDKKLVRFENYCWVFSCCMMGGISLGNFIFVSKYNATQEPVIRHELGHVIQSHVLGPIYLLLIGLPSILWATFGSNDKCYHEFFTEASANRLAGLKIGKYPSGRCYIYIPTDDEDTNV